MAQDNADVVASSKVWQPGVGSSYGNGWGQRHFRVEMRAHGKSYRKA